MNGKVERLRRELAEAEKEAGMPVSGEPVAYFYKHIESSEVMVSLDDDEVPAARRASYIIKPLFTHPPLTLAAKAEVKRLREAIEHAHHMLTFPAPFDHAQRVGEAIATLAAALSTPADTSEIDRLVADAGRAKWQPIETAPKDGTVFIGWVSAERWSSADGEFSTKSHDVSVVDFCWWRKPPSDMEYGGYFDNGAGQVGDMQEITHWMPLPDAPDAARAEVKS